MAAVEGAAPNATSEEAKEPKTSMKRSGSHSLLFHVQEWNEYAVKKLNFTQALEGFAKTNAVVEGGKIFEKAAEFSKNLTAKMPSFSPIPLDVPMHRRRQTAAVVLFCCIMPITLCCFFFALWLLYYNMYTRAFMLGYFAWIAFDNGPQTGRLRFYHKLIPFRDLSLWVLFRDYFPIDLHKTTDLDPNAGTYLFGYHPHGIISIGAIGNFATNATGFKEKFPGINIRLATLAQNFYAPFIREFTLGMGLVDASKQTCKNILGGKPGGALMLVVGGAAESLDAKKGTYTLSLYHKGFVKQACIYGSFLVPVISFGETEVFELFDNQPGSAMRKAQDFIKRVTGVAPAFFKGRGVFNRDSAGVLPFREPITSVVGAPIKCPKITGHIEDPENKKIVDEYHLKYIAALKALWAKYKEEFAQKRKGSIQFKESQYDFIEPMTRNSDDEKDDDENDDDKAEKKRKGKVEKTKKVE